MRRRIAITLGGALGASAVALSALLGCVCAPAGPPTMQRCDSPTLPTSVTSVVLRESDGTTLDDGDAVPIFFGAQGGQHVQFEVELVGTGFGGCLAQSTRLLATDGTTVIAMSDTPVPTDVTGDTARTRPILLFPSGGEPTSAILRVTIAGETIERRLGRAATVDAGVADAAAAPDAASDAAAADAMP